MKLSDHLPPFMIAILFCIAMAVMTAIGIGASKGNPLADVATIVGGFGQVFFAGAVYLLSRRQFDFTKQVAHRQSQIDAYSVRKELLERVVKMTNAFNNNNALNRDEANAWIMISQEARHVFSSEIGDELFAAGERVYEIARLAEERRTLNSYGEPVPDDKALTGNERKEFYDLQFSAWRKMNEEMSVAPISNFQESR